MQKEIFLPFAKPSIDDETIAEVLDCLKSGWLTTGPRVQRFADALKTYLKTSHALPISSGTAGLHVALLALDLQPGDEVITSAMTFVASLNTIVLAGAKPVLVDVEPHTYNIDIRRLERAITPKTRAIMPVHFAGLAVDLDPLYEIAKIHNLRIIEDAAHAIGTFYKDKIIGSFGDTQVFSFHPNKNMTTGEGGCVTTSDPTLAHTVQILRFHGIDKTNAWNRFAKGGSQHYDVVAAGFKYNMMDIQAAIGLHQLNHLEDFIARRTLLANRYLKAFAGWPQFQLPQSPAYSNRHAWHLFAPLIVPEKAGLSRDEFMTAMAERNVGTGLHYTAPHLFSFYQKHYDYRVGDFPHAEHIGEHIVSLPLFPDMTEAEQDHVIATIAAIFNRKLA
ncbi:MAG: spore coat protein [Gammaproteobacteria bacterium]|jgi:dTDP-4-amino-4,6-dideoxygalactose transaminase|nr:spore coat protein [Gammaproteobacteria bacterium]